MNKQWDTRLSKLLQRKREGGEGGRKRGVHSCSHCLVILTYSSILPVATSSAAAIPRPEAISKNIIIPATNLTGKDIANLTSSAASSATTSPVVESLPPFDRLPSGDVLVQQANAALQSDPSASSESIGPSGGALGRVPALVHTGHSQSPPPNPSHPTSVIQHDSAHSPHVGLAHPHGLQPSNNSSSPRPSILRRRPHERLVY